MLGLRKRLVGNSMLAVLLALSMPVVHAQETDKEDHFNPLPDGTYRFSNQHGTGINRDYYVAPNHGPPDSSLLYKVERVHMGQKEWDNLAKGQYDSALNDVKYTLRRFPNHPTALMMISIIAKMTDRKMMAIRYFDHAITLYPQYALTHALYGKYLIDIGMFDAGIEKLERAIEKDAKLGKAHGWLAEAYAKNGRAELALEAAKRARGVGYRGRIAGVKEQ